MAGGSLAERHDAHQHSAARAVIPDAVALDAAVQVAAAAVLLAEGARRRYVNVSDRGHCPRQ